MPIRAGGDAARPASAGRGRGRRPALLVLAGAAFLLGAAGPPALAGGGDEEDGKGGFAVVGVEPGDVLVVRAGPGPDAARVGKIPPDGVGVTPTGNSRRVGPGLWREVRYGRLRGWVNGRYLRALAAGPGGTTVDAATAADPPRVGAPDSRPRAGAGAPRAASPQSTAVARTDLPAPALRTATATATATAMATAPAPAPAPLPRPLPAALGQRLRCLFDEPAWALEIDRDGHGRVSPNGPAGAPPEAEARLVAAAQRSPTVPDRWILVVEGADGAPFLVGALRRSHRCFEQLPGPSTAYEVTARRRDGPAFEGCCYAATDAMTNTRLGGGP